mgnify:CR=1 FL=1
MKYLKYYSDVINEIKPEDWNLKELSMSELHQREDYNIGVIHELEAHHDQKINLQEYYR